MASRCDRRAVIGNLMKVSVEPISVLAVPHSRDVTLVLGGYRIVLTREEARSLIDELGETLGDQASNAAIVAKVAEQVISWAQIAQSVTPRK
jgi:hypothetical protein